MDVLRARCAVLVLLAISMHGCLLDPAGKGADTTGGAAGSGGATASSGGTGGVPTTSGIGGETSAGGVGAGGASTGGVGAGGTTGGTGGSGGTGSMVVCGNGVIDAGEECDDGNDNDLDTCGDCKVRCTMDGSITTNASTLVHPVTHHCYLLAFDPNSNWQQARNDCLAWGGDLAALTDQQEITDVIGLLGMSGEDIWIGGTDEASDGVFVWVDGEPWTYTNKQPPWHHNAINGDEPNGGINENCVEMFTNGDLNDEHCSSAENWLCERPPAGAPP